MKAMYLTSIGTMELREEDQPVPGPGEVLLKMGAIGICGSDVHYFKSGNIGSDKAIFPQGLGHEPSGTIIELGKGVEASRLNERVTIEPGIGCGVCEFCISARGNLCPDVVFLASPGIQGAYKEFMVMPAENCFKVPDNISLNEAAMFEPFGVGVEAADIANIQAGQTACVLGCGSIGLSTMAAARAMGVTTVYGVDPLDWRRQAAQDSFGADEVFGGGNDEVETWLMDQTNGRGVDIVFEASGDHKAFTIMTDLAVRGGTAVIIGIPTVSEYVFNAHTARRKGLTMVNCRRFNRKLPPSIAIAEAGLVNLSKLVTHEFSLEETAKGFELVDAYEDGVIKAVVKLDG